MKKYRRRTIKLLMLLTLGIIAIEPAVASRTTLSNQEFQNEYKTGKDVTVTFDKNVPKAYEDKVNDLINMKTYNYGDEIAGIGIDGSSQDQSYYWDGKVNNSFIPTMYRFVGWNTEPDGSGRWYRGKQQLTEEDGNNLYLYQQSIELLPSTLTNSFNAVTSTVFLNQSNHYIDKENALIINRATDLKYKSVVETKEATDALKVLWGRPDKIVNHNQAFGKIRAYFDDRVQFEEKLNICFESTWLQPKNYNYREGNKYMFELDTKVLEKSDGKIYMDMDVQLIERTEFIQLSYDDFFEPMIMTLATDYDNGMKTIISQDSFNDIARSNNPYTITGGEITFSMDFDAGNILGVQTIQLDSEAEEQYVHFVPTGYIYGKYQEENGKPLQETKQLVAGEVGKPYTVDWPNVIEKDGLIYDFVSIEESGKESGVITLEDQYITFIYRKRTHTESEIDEIDNSYEDELVLGETVLDSTKNNIKSSDQSNIVLYIIGMIFSLIILLFLNESIKKYE